MSTEANLRKCIKCDSAMTPKMVEDVEVDFCPECRGLWLDRDEIKALADKTDDALEELRDLVQKDAPPGKVRSNIDQPCPACEGRLSLASFGLILVEHCTSCDGIYLDRGELDRAMWLIKSRAGEAATIVALARSVVARGMIGD